MAASQIARSVSRYCRSSLLNANATIHGHARSNRVFAQRNEHGVGLGFLNSSMPNQSPFSFSNPGFARFLSTTISGNVIKEGNQATNVESRNSPSFLNRVYHAAVSPFFHLEDGIREIIDDYVHNEMTRNFVLVAVRLYLLIVIKDVILALLY